MWDYSPRQMAGFLSIANKRQQRELREHLAVQAMAARGDPKAIAQALKEDRR